MDLIFINLQKHFKLFRMDPINPDKTVPANLQGQQQQPQPQQAQGPGQSGQVGGAAALEHPNYNPQQHQQDCTVKKQQGKKSTTIFMGEKSTWTIIGK